MTTLKVAEIAMGHNAISFRERPLTQCEQSGELAPEEKSHLEPEPWLVEQAHAHLYFTLDCARRSRIERSRHPHWSDGYEKADREYSRNLASVEKACRKMRDAGVEADDVLESMLRAEGFK